MFNSCRLESYTKKRYVYAARFAYLISVIGPRCPFESAHLYVKREKFYVDVARRTENPVAQPNHVACVWYYHIRVDNRWWILWVSAENVWIFHQSRKNSIYSRFCLKSLFFNWKTFVCICSVFERNFFRFKSNRSCENKALHIFSPCKWVCNTVLLMVFRLLNVWILRLN